jgi:hypothetical protein
MRTTKRRRENAHTSTRSKEGGEKNTAFFLSFFLSRLYEFRSVKGRRGRAKSDDEEQSSFTKTLSRAYIYILSLSFGREEETARVRRLESSLVFDRCIPRLCVVVTAKRFFRTHKTYILKYLIEHFKQKREKRWPRRRNTSRN